MDKDKILEAIKGTGGIMTNIARKLSLSWHMAYDFCQMYEETKKAITDEQETMLDMAENTIGKSIQDGDVQTSKWYLAMKGKKRGYIEKQEIEHSGSGQLVIVRHGNKPPSESG